MKNKILDHFVKSNLLVADSVQQYFQKLRALDELDSKDGEAIGYAFMSQRTTQKNVEKSNHVKRCVELVVADHLAFKELKSQYRWITHLVEGMMDDQLFLVPPKVNSSMLNLSDREAKIIGRKLNKALKSKKIVEAGVDHWMLQHPSMVEMGRKYPFFIPMCIIIGRRKVKEAIWGASFRVYFAVALSLLDILTDINAIRVFFEKGRTNYAWANLFFLCASLALQLLVVWMQNRKRGWKYVIYGSFSVLLMAKPGVDAWRIANDNVQKNYQVMNPEMEGTFSKCIEMVSYMLRSMLSVLSVFSETNLTTSTEDSAIVLSREAITNTNTNSFLPSLFLFTLAGWFTILYEIPIEVLRESSKRCAPELCHDWAE